jgi:hypothetical protein
MGTTSTALATQPGARMVWVLAIEGYDQLITNHDNLAAVVTAWSEASEWTGAIGGLFVTSAFEQKLDPWNPFVPAGDLRVVVRDVDGADAFGKAVFRRGGGEETYLATSLDNDAVTATVKDSDQFPASGTIYIGAERISYTAETGTSFTTLTRGRCAPFAADTETVPRFGRYHRAGVAVRSTGVDPIVSTLPRTWHGKWVGLWMHRVVGGVLDTRGQAQCVWAGTIEEITDASNGDTQVTAKHVTERVPQTVLLRDQWTAEVAEGIQLTAGGVDFELGVFAFQFSGSPSPVTQNAAPLVVVDGASGAYQIEDGYHGLDTIISALNGWLAQALADNDISLRMTFSVEPNSAGEPRVVIRWDWLGAAYQAGWVLRMPTQVWLFLGFDNAESGDPGERFISEEEGLEGSRTAALPPRIAVPWTTTQATGAYVDVINVSGSFINQLHTMPAVIRNKHVDAGATDQTWGFVWIAGVLFIARVMVASGTTATLLIKPVPEYMPIGNRVLDVGSSPDTEDGGVIEVRQVVILEGAFSEVMPRLLASTGSPGYNHATYDAYGHGLGCEIPWDLLGPSLVDSCALLDHAGATTRIVLEKPTTLSVAIGGELALRKASLIWKSGGLRFTGWGSMTASRAVVALTEENKGAPVDQRDAQRTPLMSTTQWLRNVLKVEFDRQMFTDDYHETFQWEDRASMDDVGEEKAVTIQARNSYQAAGDVIRDLAAGLFASMTYFARPVLLLRRTIDMSLFEGVAPGDIVIITDRFARDPATGERGLVEKPGIIVAHRWDRGGTDPSNPKKPRPMFGEVDIAIDAVDRVFAWAPAALIDDSVFSGGFTAGYNSATNTIRCKANEYTLAADGVVDVTYFEVGDEVTVIEVDPAGGTSQTWARAINSKSGNDLTLSASLTGFDTAKKYRVVPQDYVSVGADLRDVAYQADDADARVQNTAAPYLWGEEYGLEVNQPPAWSQLDLPERYSSSSYGNGVPLDVGFETGLVRMAINLMAFKTAPQVPCLDGQARAHGSVAGSWKLHAVVPHFVGPTTYPSGYTRKLYVAPFFRSGSGASVQVRVTLCKNPPTGDSLDDVPVTGVGTAASATFATSSTSFSKPTAVGLRTEPAGSGECYLFVEVNSAQAQVYGLAELRLGPLEAI